MSWPSGIGTKLAPAASHALNERALPDHHCFPPRLPPAARRARCSPCRWTGCCTKSTSCRLRRCALLSGFVRMVWACLHACEFFVQEKLLFAPLGSRLMPKGQQQRCTLQLAYHTRIPPRPARAGAGPARLPAAHAQLPPPQAGHRRADAAAPLAGELGAAAGHCCAAMRSTACWLASSRAGLRTAAFLAARQQTAGSAARSGRRAAGGTRASLPPAFSSACFPGVYGGEPKGTPHTPTPTPP